MKIKTLSALLLIILLSALTASAVYAIAGSWPFVDHFPIDPDSCFPSNDGEFNRFDFPDTLWMQIPIDSPLEYFHCGSREVTGYPACQIDEILNEGSTPSTFTLNMLCLHHVALPIVAR